MYIIYETEENGTHRTLTFVSQRARPKGLARAEDPLSDTQQ